MLTRKKALGLVAAIVVAAAIALGMASMRVPPEDAHNRQKVDVADIPEANPQGTDRLGPVATSVTVGKTWNVQSAQAIANVFLGKHDFCKHPSTCEVDHWLVKEATIEVDGVPAKLLIYASMDAEIHGQKNCHSCAPHLSTFEFRQIGGAWALGRSDVAFADGGSWGELSGEQIDIISFGTNGYGVFLTDAYMSYGHDESTLKVFTRIGGKLTEVLVTVVGENNDGRVSDANSPEFIQWSGAVSVASKDEAAAVPDVLVNRTGLRRGFKLNDVQVFRFIGTKYEQVNPADSLSTNSAASQ